MNSVKNYRFALAAAVMGLGALTLACAFALPETDIFWSIRYGQNLLAGGAFAPVETWDFSAAGAVWVPNSWAWNVLLALVYNAGGTVGLALLNGLAFGAACWLAWSLSARLNLNLPVCIASVSCFGAALETFFTARATTADVLVLLGFSLLLSTGRLRRTRWLLAASFALAVLGANFHLSAPIYVALFPALALTLAPVKDRRGQLLRGIGVGAVSALATLCTPFGFTGLTKGATVAAASRGLIIEWSAPNLQSGLGWLTVLFVAVGLAVAALCARRGAWWSAAVLAALASTTLIAIRFSLYLVVLTFILFAARLRPTWQPRALSAVNRRLVLVFSAVLLSAAVIFAGAQAAAPAHITGVNPADFTAFRAHSRVLSDPATGSALILYRPDVQVAIDGRNDLLGAKRYRAVANVYGYGSAAAQSAWLARNHVSGVWVPAHAHVSITAWVKAHGWVAHAGQYGTAWVKPTG